MANIDDIINKLDKRQRLALRRTLDNETGSAPTHCVKKLTHLGLVELTGHFHEPAEYGRAVRREPKFYLTVTGKAVAQALKDRLSAQNESHLKELIGLVVERRIREVETSDGSTVKHGSKKHVKDLERRIGELKRWRDRERKGSDARANYSRVISRLTQQLNAAKRNGLKEGVLNELTNAQFFHISSKDLGEKFTFTPRLPNAPFSNPHDLSIAEDTHTLRTSWAPSIEDAAEALQGSGVHKTNMRLLDGCYVYSVANLPGKIDTEKKFNKCPSSPDNEYGQEFSRKQYAAWRGLKQYSPEIEDELTYCVPDAPETHELWATKPVTARKIGYIDNGKLVLNT
jgi:hypothetical protein